MALSEVRLGDLVELVEETNKDLLFGEEDVRGMTITKQIIPTKADVSGADLSKYWIVRPDYFVYNPRTHGKKIGLGYNDSGKSFIISWNNVSFRIKEAMKNKILPQYLFLHFNRAEWDRNACFCSWGSSTEVFSWDALGDMVLELPSIEIQQKYVDIYQGMVNNQKAYERGLEDLKLVCDGYIEDLRSKLPSEPIGKYLSLSDRRNDIGLGLESVRGISIDKKFIFTKADMEGVGLSNYKVVLPNYLAFVPVTSRNGEKISLAYNDRIETYIVSSSYSVFYISDKKLYAPYLNIILNRQEFNRYARFNSWGSAREVFSFDDMCSVKIPIPAIEVQKSVADIFKVYNTRKRINEQLKAQIKDVCPILIKGSIDEAR